MKTRLAVGLILIALLSYGSMFNIPAVSGQAADDGSTRTVWSEAQATALANAWVAHKAPTFSEWQEAAVGSPVLYYDLDGLPVVYVFSVLNKNQDVGHIIVSYEVSDDPILVFGQGAAPHLRCPTCTDVQTLAAQGLVLAAKNPIYLGPVDYFYHVEPAAAQSQTTEENSYQLIPMGESVPMRITHQPASATPQDVLAGSAPDLSSSDVSGAATSKLIWGVPDYNQFLGSAYGYDYSCYSGCTPTAATNIVHFWDQAGYSGLAYTNWRDTTYYLRTYMETFCSGSSGSTYSDQPAPAMIKYAQTRGFSFSSMQYCWPGTNWLGCIGDAAWNVYTSQIDLSHPVLISLDTSTYGGHSVTGVGYDTDGGQYWIIHDNWPSTGEDIYVNSALSADRFYYPFIPPTHDSGAPSAAISAPRYHRAGTSIPVSWSGRDAATGVARYDVQSQVSGSASWQDLLTSTTDTSTTFAGQVGNTYTFRSRAYDWMGNVSAWVEAQSTVYQYQVTGRVTGNRDYGVIGAQVAAAPGALNTAQPSPGGAFGLYFAAAQTADLTASASGFGSLYAMKGVSVSHDYSGLHFALPPLTEQLTNGHFESELAGWQASTAPAPAAIQGAGHTGDYALALGMSASVTTTVWQITQSVTSVITDKPTLSWFYVVSGTTSADDRLWVSVARPGGLPTQTNILSVSLPLTATAWTHQWLALDEFAGSTVTITFGVQNADTSTVSIVLLDEVSLGEGNKQLRQIFLPVVFKTW